MTYLGQTLAADPGQPPLQSFVSRLRCQRGTDCGCVDLYGPRGDGQAFGASARHRQPTAGRALAPGAQDESRRPPAREFGEQRFWAPKASAGGHSWLGRRKAAGWSSSLPPLLAQ